MIAAFSSSSPVASVAIFNDAGEVLFEFAKESKNNALSVLTEGIESSAVELDQVKYFAADIGPGSFTGTRVAVMMAKTFAWNFGRECLAATAFDLISVDNPVFLPLKKGHWFFRNAEREVLTLTEILEDKALGYGVGIVNPTFPLASNFSTLISKLTPISPFELDVAYLVEPNISTPKQSLSKVGDRS